jgi:hypothetical protein
MLRWGCSLATRMGETEWTEHFVMDSKAQDGFGVCWSASMATIASSNVGCASSCNDITLS